MTVSGTIISDKKNKWTQYSVTLPVSKKQIISSKYIAYLFWVIVGLIVGTLICLAVLKITNTTDNYMNIFIGFSIIISLLSGSIIMPCNFVLPEEQSIIGTILAYSLTSGILALSIFGLNQIFNVRENMNMTLVICCIISAVIYIISWIVS